MLRVEKYTFIYCRVEVTLLSLDTFASTDQSNPNDEANTEETGKHNQACHRAAHLSHLQVQSILTLGVVDELLQTISTLIGAF